MPWDFGWKPYISVAERKAQASREMRALQKSGLQINPISIAGRKIVTTFWGESWCTHLESFGDYANRLPRGRTYVRNGSVCHLEIVSGRINAFVSGSAMYEVKIEIGKLSQTKWIGVKQQCTGKIGTLLELLQGNLSDSVMSVVTDRDQGLFPLPGEIKMKCSCPDYAAMCKHIAAVLYGVGARLDQSPELLFLLRGVDHQELIYVEASAAGFMDESHGGAKRQRLDESSLADVFGIEILDDPIEPATRTDRKFQPERTDKPKASSLQADSIRDEKSEALTGKTIRDLRARLKMSKTELALLVGVSSTSVANWENTRGKLSLSPASLRAVMAVMNLTQEQARKKLDRGR